MNVDPAGIQMASAADAAALIDRWTAPLDRKQVPVVWASGRVLADALVSPADVPAFDRAAMDGVAVALGSNDTAAVVGSRYRLVGTAFPGRPYPSPLAVGEAVRVTTGAPAPAGTDAVLMIEHVRFEGETVIGDRETPRGRNVGRRGEDVRMGDVVLPAGRRLRPMDVALAAALGQTTLTVYRRPTVAILPTGNELVPVGQAPGPFDIIESNSAMLAALIERDGGVPVAPPPFPIIPDQPEAMRTALATTDADILLVSGGTSKGSEDHAPDALAAVGTVAIRGVRIRPGAPVTIGSVRGRPVFLLPGNPVACLWAYDLLARRAVCRLSGRSTAWPYRTIEGRLTRDVASVDGRLDCVRVRVSDSAVEPITASGASRLSTVTAADGFLLIEEGTTLLESGAAVTVYLYDPL